MRQATLARRTLGHPALLVFSVGASSPLTVLVGGIDTVYERTGVVGVPLAFLVVMVILIVLVVGYVSVSRHVTHSAPFYAQLVRGFNPAIGVAGAAVALLGYNAIQISLYGFMGTILANLLGGSWWVWAAAAWLVVAGLGQLRGAANAKILGSLLAVEIAVILLFDAAAFLNPADGTVSPEPLLPSSLMVNGVSGALVFVMAAFTGVESPPAFGEEARSPSVVARATFGGIALLGVFYAVSAWAFATATGPGHVVEAAGSAEQGPLSILEDAFGAGMIELATLLLVTSVLVSMVAFHSTVARYVFALAREQVLPSALAKVSTGVAGGAPLGGSLLQSAMALVVMTGFAVAGADPTATMFVWLSTIAALCVLLLLTASSVAAVAFFDRGGGTRESLLIRRVLPTAGGVLGVVVLLITLANLSSLLGTPPGSVLPHLIILPIIASALGGFLWGLRLRRLNPEIYGRLSRGAPNPVTVLDQRLSDLAV